MFPRWIAVAGVLALTAACSSGGDKSATPAAGKKVDPYAAQVTITPGNGGTNARPDKGVAVKVANASLAKVTVQNKSGRAVSGAMTKDRTGWASKWALTPGESYTVTATATRRDGKSSTHASKFTTLKPAQRFGITSIAPAGGVVGIGMPIMVSFDRPVFNRDLVERSLELRANRRVTGAWNWVSNQQVVFRTKKYWPVGTQVSLVAHTSGVRGAKNVYGTADRSVKFSVGDAHISTVNVKTHKMSVQSNGTTVKTVGISAGKGDERKFTTTNGVHLTMDKGNPVVMTSEWQGITDKKDPDYYKLKVKHAVRISNSGEYVHSAPWSVAQQGKANVSHGCVNASPEFAEWFYNLSQPGDVVVVTGTNRELEPYNGWGHWQMSFDQWMQGSALKRAVSTGQRSGASGTSGSSSADRASTPAAGQSGARESLDDF